jgi:hypothetical protein
MRKDKFESWNDLRLELESAAKCYFKLNALEVDHVEVLSAHSDYIIVKRIVYGMKIHEQICSISTADLHII